MFRIFWVFSAALRCYAVDALAAEPIGVVKTLSGTAWVVRAGQPLPCGLNAHILAQDIIRTSGDGRVGILFSDGARVSLDPSSELKIDRFRFRPAQREFEMVMMLVRGVAAYVSGKVARFAPESVKMETPVAVIGLRGTQFAVSLDQK
ncbi:MAG: FecR domain-containing protein [Bryobacteraceae bacterium]